MSSPPRKSKGPLPNRLAVYVTALGTLAAGLLPLVGNLDWESTAGVLGAIIAIAGVVSVWLYNWGKWERVNLELASIGAAPPVALKPEDVGEAHVGTTYQPPPAP